MQSPPAKVVWIEITTSPKTPSMSTLDSARGISFYHPIDHKIVPLLIKKESGAILLYMKNNIGGNQKRFCSIAIEL